MKHSYLCSDILDSIMVEESEIMEGLSNPDDPIGRFVDPQLLFSNSRNRLYRLSRNGKYFMLKTASDPFAQTLLRRESDLSSTLSHPYLVHVWGFEEDTPVGPGLLMEYIHGRSLDVFLSGHPSAGERRKVFRQLLEVVSYLHHSGLVHNDLKPGNILITYADDDVRLIDLGFADNDAHAMEKSLGMTPRYASPELRRRAPGLDARSDIYAMGWIMRDLFGHRYLPISRKCLAKNPDDRYRDMECLKSAWNRRHLPLQILVSMLLFFLILFPTFLYVRERRERVLLQNELLERECLADSLGKVIGERLELRYEAAADSIGRTGERITRLMYLNHYLEYSWTLMDSLHALTDDMEVSARLDACCNRIRMSHQNQLLSIVDRE